MSRQRLFVEIALVLGLSLGMSALYSLVGIAVRVGRDEPLSEQTATLNRSASTVEWADFAYQILGIAQSLVPVALVLFLLYRASRPRFGALGLDATKPVRDGVQGFGLAALIGIPGLGVYFVGRELDLTVSVVPTALGTYWWTIPMLLLLALRAGLVEEIIAVGHLYQGFGAFIGNVAMGLIFGAIYARTGRLAPLIVGHTLIDAVAFVGYPVAVELYPEILG